MDGGGSSWRLGYHLEAMNQQPEQIASGENDRTTRKSFLTVADTALLLGVNRKTVYAAIQAGTLPGVIRIGRSIRINRRILLNWASNDRVPS